MGYSPFQLMMGRPPVTYPSINQPGEEGMDGTASVTLEGCCLGPADPYFQPAAWSLPSPWPHSAAPPAGDQTTLLLRMSGSLRWQKPACPAPSPFFQASSIGPLGHHFEPQPIKRVTIRDAAGKDAGAKRHRKVPTLGRTGRSETRTGRGARSCCAPQSVRRGASRFDRMTLKATGPGVSTTGHRTITNQRRLSQGHHENASTWLLLAPSFEAGESRTPPCVKGHSSRPLAVRAAAALGRVARAPWDLAPLAEAPQR